MKHLFTIWLLLFPVILYAQTDSLDKPVNNSPAISITPSTTTTITQQPPSIPVSNTNPTTGTVISLKGKNASKAKPHDEPAIDSLPVLNKADGLPKSQNKSAGKRATKKNKG